MAASDTVQPGAPVKPTHFVISAADVFATIGPGSTAVRKLGPGAAVALVKTEGGWTLVAREGQMLGYIATKDLLPIQ